MIASRFLRDAARFGLGKRSIATIVALHLASTAFEVVGLGTIVPLGELMIAGGDVDSLAATSGLWQWMQETLGTVGLPLGLPTLLIITFLCMLLRQLFAYVRDVYQNCLRERLVYETRMVGMRGYLKADLAFQSATPAGMLVNDLTTELGRAIGSLFSAITLLNYALVGVAYFVVMLALSWEITLIATVTLASGAFLLRGILRRSEMGGRMITKANQALSEFFVERLSQARLIRLTGTEEGEMQAMHHLADDQRRRTVAVAIMTARINSIIEPLSVSIGLVLIFLGYSMFSLELPVIGLFLIIMMRLLPIAQVTMVTRQAYLANLASKHIVLERLDAMAASVEPQGGDRIFDRLDKGIAFRDVAFSYPSRPGHKALYDVSVEVPAHRITALVGPSGSGKSTLVDLIPRLRLPDRGEILFDGVPSDAFRLESLRRAMAYVPQAAQIFDVTAAQHIRYGKGDATDEEVVEAARLAGAHTFIMNFPDGYRTRLGQVGSSLSGGQRQRLDMARALVSKAPILLLDEPTSALDAEAEQAFRDALLRIRQATETTVIIVGHRLSTVREADQIVVLREGRVEDVGTHKALLARGGWYAAACRTQFGAPEEADDAAIAAGVLP